MPAAGVVLIGAVVLIVAALVVWVRPRFGGYLVAVWLWGIIIDLLLIPGYFDVALRDLGLSLGALALARLAEAEAPARAPQPKPSIKSEKSQKRSCDIGLAFS